MINNDDLLFNAPAEGRNGQLSKAEYAAMKQAKRDELFALADPYFSAYCTAYYICKKYGVDTQRFDFTDAPAVFSGMDAQQIKGELQQIRDAAGIISARMVNQLDAAQKAAKTQEAR